MLIIWSGWGILVPLLNVVGLFASVALIGLLGLSPAQSAPATTALWGVLSGLAVFFVARLIENKPGRTFIDAATDQRFTVRPSAGSFFFIPTRVWAFITPVVGVTLAVLAFTQVWDPFAEPAAAKTADVSTASSSEAPAAAPSSQPAASSQPAKAQ
jgi:hypothetical protein